MAGAGCERERGEKIVQSKTISYVAAMCTGVALMFAGAANAVPLTGVTLDSVASSVAFNGWTLGYSFKAQTSVDVVSLGIWDHSGDGLNEGHKVGLWDASQNLLASVDVLSGTSSVLSDGFRWVDMTGSDIVTLITGTVYVVGAYYDSTNSDAAAIFSPISVDSRISYIGSSQFSSGALQFPSGSCCNTPPSSTHYYGGNVRLDNAVAGATIPEPVTLALMGLALSGLGFKRRRAA